MNKRDIIIIAVLLNTGLLSMLAMMAIHTDESFEEPQESSIIAYENPKAMLAKDPLLMAPPTSVATDEWDNVLKDYVLASSSQSQMSEEEEFEKEAESPKKIVKEAPVAPQKPLAVEKAITKAPAPAIEKPVILTQNTKVGKTIEVTVKKGDVLEKIAKANGTTTEQIKALNNLKSDRLAVGQQLKIAVDSDKIAKATPQPVVAPSPASDEVEYYVLKSGDNPWKIAKQFKVKFEDLLKMNQLDEEKARNLKIGDRIRVK